MHGNNYRALLGGIVLAVAIATVAVQAALQATLATTSITAGSNATVHVRAAAGAAVTVTASGAGQVRPASATVPAAGTLAVQIGPFAQPGEYGISVVAGTDRASATLRVEWPRGSGPAAPVRPGALGAAVVSAIQASQQALDAAGAGLGQMPADPGIGQARQDVQRLRGTMTDLQRQAEGFRDAVNQVEQALGREPNADPAVVDQFNRFAADTERALKDQADQLIALGREASGPQADACIRAEVVATTLQAQEALTSIISSGMTEYLADLARDQAPEFARDAATWARSRFTGGRPLASDGPAVPLSNSTAAPRAGGGDAQWEGAKTALTYVRAGLSGGAWGIAQQLVSDAVSGGINAFTERQCLTWSGDMSGSTHVEALEKGQPFYGLQNTWQARVRLSGARPATAGSAVAMRGMIFGRAKEFKVVNKLQTLYGGRPAALIQYLTTQPNAVQTSTAIFAVSIEGTAQGNQLALKVRDGKVDYAGRVQGKMAAIVIPLASPIPIVQTYEVPFQGGHWQLMRALGASGTTVQPIVTSATKRVVDASYPRDLSATGARGHFTIRMHLCGGDCG